MEENEMGTPAPDTTAPDTTDAAPESRPDNGPGKVNDAPEPEPKADDDTPQKKEEPQDPDSLPMSKWEDGMVSLPEGIEADADMLSGFGEAAVAAGLTRKQAQALVDWQGKFLVEQAKAQMEKGMETLRTAWGSKAEANQRKVVGLVSRIDRALGDDSFSRALGESGATRHAGVVLGLHKLAELMAEDSLGSAAGAAAEHEETALEGLENALKEARRGK